MMRMQALVEINVIDECREVRVSRDKMSCVAH